MEQNQSQVKDITYFREQYPTLLKEMAFSFDEKVEKGLVWNYGKAVNIVSNAMWLIECEETNNPDEPFCIYYHESGNTFGFTTFKDETTFVEACKNFLNSTWGIQPA